MPRKRHGSSPDILRRRCSLMICLGTETMLKRLYEPLRVSSDTGAICQIALRLNKLIIRLRAKGDGIIILRTHGAVEHGFEERRLVGEETRVFRLPLELPVATLEDMKNIGHWFGTRGNRSKTARKMIDVVEQMLFHEGDIILRYQNGTEEIVVW